MKEIIHFAHGNGFPSPCYRQMLDYLGQDYEINYIDRIGHSPDFPVTDNWHYLIDEVINSIEASASTPVIGVGHSLGGILTAVAAIEKPEYFKAVVLLDSPLYGTIKSNLMKLAKMLGIFDRATPALATKGRRRHWKTKQEVIDYFKTREAFKLFNEACLEDYITYGLEHNEEGYFLRYDRHVEYLIYRTFPHTLHQYEGRLTVPGALIYGTKTNIIMKSDVRYMKAYYGLQPYLTKGTHLFPFEHPKLAAMKVKKAISAILK